MTFYDFSFAELAVEYLETGDSVCLDKIAELDAAIHLLNHAKRFGYDVPKGSAMQLVTYLLFPLDKQRNKLSNFKRNIKFAKQYIAEEDFAGKIALQYLPKDFVISASIFFTFGYDIGVAYGKNCSLNLAHSKFLENMHEIKYYAVHELHHTGFIALKNGRMPSLNVSTRKEMAHIIEYLTHMEGMATYAALDIRKKENAMNADGDYIALQDSKLMTALEEEYFDIYCYFKKEPDKLIDESDWQKINILSDAKRLWYRVGASMAKTIDYELGRDKLTSMISESSENFILTYLKLQ